MTTPVVGDVKMGYKALWPDWRPGKGLRKISDAVNTNVFSVTQNNADWNMQVSMSSIKIKKNWETYYLWAFNA